MVPAQNNCHTTLIKVNLQFFIIHSIKWFNDKIIFLIVPTSEEILSGKVHKRDININSNEISNSIGNAAQDVSSSLNNAAKESGNTIQNAANTAIGGIDKN